MIKKYVLLKNNNIVKFYDDNKFGFTYIEREQDGIIFTRSALTSDVKLTSDNILDLVEVGDLVETDGDIMNVRGIYTNTISLCRDFVDKTEIKAIYKRQSNGDYKRYEVNDNAKND